MGLAASLNPIASGGAERRALATRAGEEAEICEKPGGSTATAGPSQTPGANGVPKGFGKIIRDAAGNVVDVQLGDEDEEDEVDDDMAREDRAMEEVPDPSADEQLAGWVGLGSDPRTRAAQGASTRVVQGE